MLNQHIGRALALAFAGGLAGCSGGGGGGGSAFCESIVGDGATVTSTGPASDTSDAADGSLYSHGALKLTAASQSGSMRATGPDGVIYPGGSIAGVFTSFLNQGSSNATLIRTYLNGVLVETAAPTATIFEPTQGGTGAELFLGFETTQPFNAVEFSETDNGANGTATYRIYEFCSDGHV